MTTITSQSRSGNATTVTVSSSLSAPIWFFWYLDGQLAATTRTTRRTFIVPRGTSTLTVLDGNTSTPPTAPAGYPATRTLQFIRSVGDVSRYRVEQQANGGSWATIGMVADKSGSWSYRVQTPRLLDLTTYAWRVFPIDAAGNDGTPVSLGSELIVRTPDAPDFGLVFDPGTTKVTFEAA